VYNPDNDGIRITTRPMLTKPRNNRALYIRILRGMTPEQRLDKAFELSQLVRELTLRGLRDRFPDASEEELHRLLLKRLERCHNRQY
jgi:hypothetical protein